MQSAVNRWVVGSNPTLGVDKTWLDAILPVWDRRPTAESTDLKSVKYGFESHRSYNARVAGIGIHGGFKIRCPLKACGFESHLSHFVKIQFTRISTHMETITTTSLIISLLSALTAGVIKFHNWSYSRGYAHGQHAGFSQGLWKAHERNNLKKTLTPV